MSETLGKTAHAVLEITMAIHDTIKAAGSNGVPSGHVYAVVMAVLTLDQYQRVISLLKQSGVVRESGHVLYHVPKK